jgi:hypothetical protein
MAARKKKRPLRPRTPSRVKKRTTRKKRVRAGHEHPELIGLGLAAVGLFLATLVHLGWEGGVVGEKVEEGLRDLVGSAAYAVPVALVVVGGLIGSSLIGVFAETGPQLFGVHFLSVFGFLLSGVLGLWLLLGVIRSGRL